MPKLMRIAVAALMLSAFALIPASAEVERFDIPIEAVVKAAGVKMHRGPDPSEAVVGRLPVPGSRLQVIGQQDDWMLVKVEEREAWVAGDRLMLAQAAPATEPADSPQPVSEGREETAASEAQTAAAPAAEPAQETEAAAESEKPAADEGEELPEEEFSVTVQDIRFEGNTVVDTATLQTATAGFRGKELTLEDMGTIADRVTLTYQEKGYILARAYLPEQEIREGVLKIAIAEGNIGKVIVADNRYFRPEVLRRYFKPQLEHGVIKEALLERGVLLTNDVRNLKTGVVLKEGEKPGEVDVVLQAEETDTLTFGLNFSLDYNNYGPRLISVDRFGASANLIDHRWGSTLDLRGVIGDTIEDSNLFIADFKVPVGPWGTRLGLNYLQGTYGFTSPQGGLVQAGEGDTTMYGTKLIHPILKTKTSNLILTVGYDHKLTESSNETTSGDESIMTPVADEVDVYYVSMNYDSLDRFLGKNILSLGYYFGDVLFDENSSTERLAPDDKFSRVSVLAARIQKIYGYTNLMVRGSAQFTDDRLMNSERVSIGGYSSIRGHDYAIASGDYGYSFSGELMFAPPYLTEKEVLGERLAQVMQLAVFYDFGAVFNKDYSAARDPYDSQYLAGYGAGVRFFFREKFNFKYDVAFPVYRYEDDSPRVFNYFLMSYSFN